MLFLFITLALFLAGALVWFVSPKLSPIPYFPTAKTDIGQIKKTLKLKKGDVCYDLGAGNGRVVFALASAKIKVVAVESNPYLVALMLVRKLFHPFGKQIKIVWQDLFRTNLQEATYIYLFVGPFLVDSIFKYILKNKGSKLRGVLFYRYFPKKVKPQKSLLYLWENKNKLKKRS